jgi:hypothetical protein
MINDKLPKFVLLVQGKGEGCHYTIACNKEFVWLEEEETMKQALDFAKEYVKDKNPVRVENLILCVVSELKSLNVKELLEGSEKAEIKILQDEGLKLTQEL